MDSFSSETSAPQRAIILGKTAARLELENCIIKSPHESEQPGPMFHLPRGPPWQEGIMFTPPITTNYS